MGDKIKGRLSQLEAANVKQTSLESARNKVVRDNLNEIEAINLRLSTLAEIPETIQSLCSSVTGLEDAMQHQREAEELKATNKEDHHSLASSNCLRTKWTK